MHWGNDIVFKNSAWKIEYTHAKGNETESLSFYSDQNQLKMGLKT
jgi:hypothetical protein